MKLELIEIYKDTRESIGRSEFLANEALGGRVKQSSHANYLSKLRRQKAWRAVHNNR